MPPIADRARGSLNVKQAEAEVLAMEQRLAALRSNMSREREKRDKSRQQNPSGSVWYTLPPP